MGKRITQAIFEKRVKSHFVAWGTRYGLNRAIYKPRDRSGKRIPVEIECPDHGLQMACAESLMNGKLPICCSRDERSKKLKHTTKKVIAAFKKKHGENRYDYSDAHYKSNNEPITIICHKHQPAFRWSPLPRSHKAGDGCPKCYNFQKSTMEFIEQASQVHNKRYSYENAVYDRADVPIIITCPIHGGWDSSTPSAHLRGKGCPKCGEEVRRKKVTKSQSEFISQAKRLHHDFYDYSEVKYKNSESKVKIICPSHGLFYQRPNAHLNKTRGGVRVGSGCPDCGNLKKGWDGLVDILDDARSQNHKPCHLYIFTLRRFPEFVKIGIANNINDRTDEEYSDNPVFDYLFESRVEARLVEINLLELTNTKLLAQCPQQLWNKKWRGASEVRKCAITYMVPLAKKCVEEIAALGKWRYALTRLNLDSITLHKIRCNLSRE